MNSISKIFQKFCYKNYLVKSRYLHCTTLSHLDSKCSTVYSSNSDDLNPVYSYPLYTPDISGVGKYVPSNIIRPEPVEVIEDNINFAEIEKYLFEKQNGMRKVCALAKMILNSCRENIKVGVKTDDIDEVAHCNIIRNGAYPSPLHYKGFPRSICTSVNNVACHGIPDDYRLKDGDIINVDVTVFLDGYHGDCSDTFEVGKVDDNGKKLISITRECTYSAIRKCGPGLQLCVIGQTIEQIAKLNGFNVIPVFCGHGIGKQFHEKPDIYHFDNDEPGIMEPGMTFTIEPILSEGGSDIRILKDGWTAVTTDNSRTAQFEHTILILDNGVEILTT
ncbi:Methionine aminopeptidase 1D, mitochondrial [Nymphon striatum]|nr:Methionine aminopeptidase 1D, mitochondrial [Nymphon striatum]